MSIEHLEPKMMLTGPQIVGISPNAGELLQAGDVRNFAPQELTFRFDENQVIDAATLGGIEVVRTDVGRTIEPGFVGLGEGSNEVVMRFAETLKDGSYRIDITGSGPNALRNTAGEAFNNGFSTSTPFALDLAPQITAVVPQPTSTGAALSQARNQIDVYFNDDDLDPVSARQPRFYQLIYTSDTLSNRDDVVHRPLTVSYDAISNSATLTFGSDLVDLSGEGTYRLRIGTDEALPGAPVLTETSEDAGNTFATATPLGTIGRADQIVVSAIDPVDYPLIYPGGTSEPGRPAFPVIPTDETPGITVVEYNFKSSIVLENGSTFFNLITEEQRERAREMVDILASKAGIQFVETADSGITIGTATLPGLVPGVVAVPFTFDNDEFGGSWFTEAMRQMIAQLDGEFSLPPDPLFAAEDPTRDFAFITPIFVDPDTPDAPVIDPLSAEQLYPRNSTVVNLQHAHRPDSNDIDVYQFTLSSRGMLTAETIAQRTGSGLDSTLRLYRIQGNDPVLLAQNDNYFGSDAFLDLNLESGAYFITVASAGLEFDPVSGSGFGGISQGDYELRISFQPGSNNSLVDTSGIALDGDSDGAPGGVFNYWFQVRDVANTIYVDKAAADGGQRGSLAAPFNTIDAAFQASQRGDVVRIVGNQNDLAYEVGFDRFGAELDDGNAMVLPQDVTVMIDEGSIFKLRKSSIQVGSSSVSIDISGSAIQVLGTPGNSVIFTSYDDESIGNDTNPLVTTPDPGDWGGILIRNDLDRAEGRFDYEQIGVFPNYISNAEMLYGGGRVSIASVERVIDPVHLIDARADVSFNRISFSADAAISANPDSFEETHFHAIDSLGVDYQAVPFTPDFARFGPDIHNNLLTNNTTNGLFVRIDTNASQRLERMSVTGRWDDLDIVHVVPENLIVEGDVGPAFRDTDGSLTPRVAAGLKIDPGTIVKLDGARIEGTIGSTILAEGEEGHSIIFTSLLDDRFGAGGTFDTSSNSRSPAAGDWSGLYIAPNGSLSIDHAVIAYGGGLSRVEGSFAAFNAIEIHQADARVTNSVLEFNGSGRGGQADLNRPGRPDNAKGAIFVRGSTVVVVDNIIRSTGGIETPAINIDVNSLSDRLFADPGRSTGFRQNIEDFKDNQGSLIRENRLADNNINGMEVRGGTISQGTVFDDTDIVHVIFESIDVPTFISTGGLRLESSSEESLVIKLAGGNAGFVGSGNVYGKSDAIGGILQVIGQPGHPVVMTSLYDDTVGAGFDTEGQPLNVTSEFNRPLPSQPADSFQVDLNFGPTIRDLPIFREAAELAARIWESMIEDPVRVTIDVDFGTLGDGVLGVTSNEVAKLDFDNVIDELGADASGRAHEVIARQIPFYDEFIEEVILPNNPQDPFTISRTMSISMANAKALGFDTDAFPQVASAFDPKETLDATILMNDKFETWDPDRTDGLLPGLYDFTGVLIHEIGHALGFVSIVDDVDAALGAAPGTTNRELEINTLDLFRFSPGAGAEDFTNNGRNLDPEQPHVLYDGGFFDPVTPRGRGALDIPNITVGDIPLSQGEENGDGAQAGHLKDNVLLDGLELGMMDPTISGPGREIVITQADRQAFDLIGWDIIGGPIPGDWRGVTLETLSHDENVGIVLEIESTETSDKNNDRPAVAEFIGSIAPNLKSGDENNRFGFTIHGLLNSDSDVDVYSFDANAGTQVWFDVDRTNATLDTVVELIDADGRSLVRSDNAYAESIGESSVVSLGTIIANPLPLNPAGGQDHFSVNPNDAGFRAFLPGASGTRNTYHLRVRSSSDQLDSLTAGQSSGNYELQLRLQEQDQLPGSTVRHADINYAVDGVRIRALPGSSPLAGTVAEDGSLNDDLPIPTFAEDNPLTVEPVRTIDDRTSVDIDEVATDDLIRDPLRLTDEGPFYPRSTADPIETEFQDAQAVGNISQTRSGAITITGALENFLENTEGVILPPDQSGFIVFDTNTGVPVAPDVDWYEFEVDGPTTVTFDVDYAAGIAGPNSSIFVYEPFYVPAGDKEQLVAAKLLYSSKDGRDADDIPAPLSGADLDDLGRGSVSGQDPLLGPVELIPTGSPSLNGGFRFMVAITAGLQPFEYQQFTVGVPAMDPERDTDAGRNILEIPPFPNNPFIRFEPVESVVRIFDEDFSNPGAAVVDAVPHHLGDVPLFLSTQTSLSLANPYNGSLGGSIGTLDIPIGDFDIRAGLGDPLTDDYNFYAYSLGVTPNDADSGNYLVINPEDATIRSVEDDGQSGNQAGVNFTDDGLVTSMLVPADPPADPPDPPDLQASDTGVQYEAIEFFNAEIGYAIGHRPDIGVDNILYQFGVPRGNTLGSDVEQDFLTMLPPPPDGLSGLTQIAERGVICVDANIANCAGTISGGAPVILSVLHDVVTSGELTLKDGTTFEVPVQGSDNLIYEINIGPELVFDLDPAAGRVMQDGDLFSVNGVSYEVDTGSVLVLANAGAIADGDTFTLTNGSVLNPQQVTFEFDLAGDGVIDGNQPIASQAAANAIVAAINTADFGVSAQGVGDRITLRGDSRASDIVISNADALVVEGAHGVSQQSTPFYVEETSTVGQLGRAFAREFGDSVVALNDRVVFPGAMTDFGSFLNSGVALPSAADSEVTPGAIGIDIHPLDTRELVAEKIAAVIGAETNQWQVIHDDTFVASSDSSALSIGGLNPGGKVTGMHFVNNQLYVVTDKGGLYTVPGFSGEAAGRPLVATYITTSTELAGARFSGLTLGPPDIEGGRYSDILFASTSRGEVYAFDTDGLPQPVFADGATSISTGVSGANGLLFSPADENLWHLTNRKSLDPGHGDELADAGLSFHFGDANIDLTENRNYNFPGGAHGSLVTDAFSLEGYTGLDLPMVYFNYALVSDASTGGQDSFRVFVTDEVGDDARGEWIMLASNQPADALLGAAPLFDSTWEDQPELYPEDPQDPTDANFILRRNGLRDPYTENRSTLDDEGNPPDEVPPYPVPSEEATIWRQARLDLSQFAGSSSLRLRFDFSSAGGLGFGSGSGGIELRAVSGDLIADGDQFVVDGVAFEFDKGLALSAPAGVLIEDGETILLNAQADTEVALQYVKSAASNLALYVPPTVAPLDNQTFRLIFNNDATRFVYDNDGNFGTAVPVDISSGRLIDSIATAINGADLPYTATVDGNLLLISEPDVQFSSLTSNFLEVTRVAIDNSMSPVAIAAATVEGINSAGSGASATQVNRTILLEGVDTVDTASGSVFRTSGQPGPNDLSSDVRLLSVNSEMTANDVAALIVTELADVFANGEEESIKTFENTIFVHGHRVNNAGPLGLATTLPGDAGHLYDPSRVLTNQFEYVEIDEDGGGGGGQFEPIDETDVNFIVPFEGAYVDDLIIGFAARGEKIVDHRLSSLEVASMIPVDDNEDRLPVLRPQTIRQPGSDYDIIRNDVNGIPPVLPDDMGNFPTDEQPDQIWDGLELVQIVDRSHFLPEPPAWELDPDFEGTAAGPYQLEIRVASTETLARLENDELIDPRERLANSVTLFASPGLDLVDGQFIKLTDGNRTVTLEYEDVSIGNGVGAGNVAIPFTVDDSDRIVSGSIRDAINNSRTVRNSLGITAASSDFRTTGIPSTNAVQLHGPVVFISADSTIDFVQTMANESTNPIDLQGQVLIESNTIMNSQMFGVVTDDGYRSVPDPNLFDAEGLLVHWPRQVGDFSSALGSTKDLITPNVDNQLPSVVIQNNVIAGGGAGGIHASGDPGGYIITPPLASIEAGTEAWDNYPFIFAITDLHGKTVQFEFDSDGQLNTVTPTVPVTITPTADCPLAAPACMPRTGASSDPNMSTELSRAIMGSGLDVQVYQNAEDLISAFPLFIEGAAEVVGIAVGESLDALLLVDWFTPWYDKVEGLRTYSRIVNNTIVGAGGILTDNKMVRVDVFNPPPGEDARQDVLVNDYTDAGILIDHSAFPTLVNNITVNLEQGLKGDESTADSVVGATLFQHNISNTKGINIGDFPIVLRPDDSLFVDISNDNFYLSPLTRAIDSSIDSIEERPGLVSVKEPVGIARSNILSPQRDVLGQLREDDPSVETPSGIGQNVFKDRGAIDRVDFVGPSVSLSNPRDNDPAQNDKDPAVGSVLLESANVVLSNFTVQFSDSTGTGDGTGIDRNTVNSESVVLRRDGRILQAGLDYSFSYDATNSVIRLTPLAGVWPNGGTYTMEFASTIQDVAGNALQSNQATSEETILSITTSAGTDFGDAPEIYPSASHAIKGGFSLGSVVTAENGSQPSPGANSDSGDDGVLLPDEFERNAANSITVQASKAGVLDAWIDFNADGDWSDSGERVFSGRALQAGPNDLTVVYPLQAAAGQTVARFRFSSTGVAGPSGTATDGEVEDYLVSVDVGNIWQNPANAFDVNANGTVSAADVLRIIQEIENSRASDPVTGELNIPPVAPNIPQEIGFVDVNGDGFVTARDARAAINEINANLAGQRSAAAAAASLSEPIVVDPIGDILLNPIVALPMAAQPFAVLDDVFADDDDDEEQFVFDVATRQSGPLTDDVFAELDWIDSEA